jgi:hypothetical protein
MKRLLAFALVATSVVLFAVPARPQTSGTTLSLQAHWDNNSAIQGTVTLAQINASGPNTVIATQALSRGRTSITVPLAANSLYNVTLVSSSGTQLVTFPITTALINPNNLSSAQLALVVHASDNSLASARIQVSMNF